MTEFERLQTALEQSPRFRKKPGFTTGKALLSRMGYKDSIPIIHIVGTNGKGSVATMLTEILRCHGLKVGTFTSPHLTDIRERMTVNGSLMPESTFIHHHETLTRHIEAYEKEGGDGPTFFEKMFLLAILHFNQSAVDVILLEAGIGGLLDTTNVLENRWLTIITAIGMDHQGLLGTTIEAIAAQKAGVIRRGVTTVALKDDEAAFAVIERINKEKGGVLVPVPVYDGFISERDSRTIDFSLDTKYYNYEHLRINSGGVWQLTNGALAITAAHELSKHITIDPKKVQEGMEKFHWPGRLEFIEPWLLVDGAHNVDGMKALADYLNTAKTGTTVDVLFACMSDKDYEAMSEILLTVKGLRKVYLPKLPYLRATDDKKMGACLRNKGFTQIDTVEDMEAFLRERADSAGAKTLVCAAGSLYLIGEIKQIQRRLTSD